MTGGCSCYGRMALLRQHGTGHGVVIDVRQHGLALRPKFLRPGQRHGRRTTARARTVAAACSMRQGTAALTMCSGTDKLPGPNSCDEGDSAGEDDSDDNGTGARIAGERARREERDPRSGSRDWWRVGEQSRPRAEGACRVVFSKHRWSGACGEWYLEGNRLGDSTVLWIY